MARQVTVSGSIATKFSANRGLMHTHDAGNLPLTMVGIVQRSNLGSLLTGKLLTDLHSGSFDLAVEVPGCYSGSSLIPNQSCT
jgi:hypothetical protein